MESPKKLKVAIKTFGCACAYAQVQRPERLKEDRSGVHVFCMGEIYE